MRNYQPIPLVQMPSVSLVRGFIPQVVEENKITITAGITNNKLASNVNAVLTLPDGDPIFVWVRCVMDTLSGELQSFTYECGDEVPTFTIFEKTGYPETYFQVLFQATVENKVITNIIQNVIGTLQITPIVTDIACNTFTRSYIVSYGS